MSNLRICMLRSVRPNVSPISQAHDASEIPDAAEDAEIDAREGKLVNSDVDHAAVKKAIDPVPLPDVPIPSPEEVRRHNLTHLPYKRLCKWCVCSSKQLTTLPSSALQQTNAVDGFGLLFSSEIR